MKIRFTKILLLMLFMCTVMTEIMAGTLLLWKKQQDTEEQRLYQNLEKMVTKERVRDLRTDQLPDLDENMLRKQNSEYAAWIFIPDTVISYPIVYPENDRKYLTVGFDQSRHSYGCLFFDSSTQPFSTMNTVIHGHNMRSGDMFGSLKNYLKQDYADFEIVVVDNNSPMNDYQKLESDIDTLQSNRIELIRNEINSGFSAGNNIGLRRAKEKDAEWSLVINPDVELRDKSYITKMISAISETHKVAVAASNVILPNGQRQNPMIEPKYWEELLWPIESVTRKIRKNNSYLGADQTGYCEKVSGCCFFIRMSFAEKMGYLDESVFLYCEEPILASRVKKYGYKELYVREITAYHMHHDSEKGNQVNRLRRFRSSRRYYWKEYSGYGKMKLAALMFSDRIYCLIKCKGREN